MDILSAAAADGRLTLDELEERVEAALTARTLSELAALIADLPGPWAPVPAAEPEPPAWASRAPERWSLLRSLTIPPATC